MLRGLFFVCTLLLCSSPGVAQNGFEHPDPQMRQRIESERSRIDELVATVRATGPSEFRTAALRELFDRYFPVGMAIAREQVVAPDSPLAREAVRILMLATVMSDHPMDAMHAEHAAPGVAYMMLEHQASLAALRRALTDEREDLREAASTHLASLSDAEALRIIAENESTLYGDAEAASIYALASGAIGAEYMLRYFGRGDLEAQRTAIAYLGSNPAYSQEVRSTYLFNREANTSLRVQATETLSQFDRSFPSYALALSLGQDTPAVLSATTAAYVEALKRRGEQIDPFVADTLMKNLDRNINESELRSFNPLQMERFRALEADLSRAAAQM